MTTNQVHNMVLRETYAKRDRVFCDYHAGKINLSEAREQLDQLLEYTTVNALANREIMERVLNRKRQK